MKTKSIQEWIERAYTEYQDDEAYLSKNVWDNLDDHDISPAAVWDAFDDGFMPIDIYINPDIIN